MYASLTKKKFVTEIKNLLKIKNYFLGRVGAQILTEFAMKMVSIKVLDYPGKTVLIKTKLDLPNIDGMKIK